MRRWRIWVDTGGTFTDGLAIDPEGRRRRVKVLSTSALRGTVRRRLAAARVEIAESWLRIARQREDSPEQLREEAKARAHLRREYSLAAPVRR